MARIGAARGFMTQKCAGCRIMAQKCAGVAHAHAKATRLPAAVLRKFL